MRNLTPGALALPLEPLALVPLEVVCHAVGARKTYVYGAVKAQRMPAPIHLGRSVRWRAGDIREYLRAPNNWSPECAIDAQRVEVAA